MRSSATAAHLGIPLAEYDARILTFLEHYEDMLHEAASAVGSLGLEQPVLLDLGIGTGALAARCIAACGGGSVIGIDSDPAMLELARTRLVAHPGVASAELRGGSFLEGALPACDAAVASFSLHHVREPEAKQTLYRRCRSAVRPGGALVLADCYLPSSRPLVETGMRRWVSHLETTYSPEESRSYMQAWAKEDTYVPLVEELGWLSAAGFRPDIVWRRDLFAVLLCT